MFVAVGGVNYVIDLTQSIYISIYISLKSNVISIALHALTTIFCARSTCNSVSPYISCVPEHTCHWRRLLEPS